MQWGDCDPAGIVFYPRYFEMFDASTILLFEKATGLTKIKMLEKYNGAGLALLEARAEFKVASAYGDDIEIASEITEFRRSSFFVRHTVTKVGALALRALRRGCGPCAIRTIPSGSSPAPCRPRSSRRSNGDDGTRPVAARPRCVANVRAAN